jgi:hypothetical protein
LRELPIERRLAGCASRVDDRKTGRFSAMTYHRNSAW